MTGCLEPETLCEQMNSVQTDIGAMERRRDMGQGWAALSRVRGEIEECVYVYVYVVSNH